MQLNGVIFDLDGTLGNTVPVSVEAIIRTVQVFTGETYTHPEIIARFGPTEQGILHRMLPEKDWAASYRRFLQEYEALHREGDYGVFPGIPQVLELLEEHRVPTAIVTGKGLDSARISLRHFGLEDAFDVVEAGSLESTVKDIRIRKVAAGWQVQPDQVIYVGDAVSDVGLARKAGALPVSAAWAGTHPPAELAAENPYRLFTRVEDMHAWLAHQVNGDSF